MPSDWPGESPCSPRLGQRWSKQRRRKLSEPKNSAAIAALEHAIPQLEKQASSLGPLRRPSNARGHEAQRDGFERRIAAALVSGLRACPLME